MGNSFRCPWLVSLGGIPAHELRQGHLGPQCSTVPKVELCPLSGSKWKNAVPSSCLHLPRSLPQQLVVRGGMRNANVLPFPRKIALQLEAGGIQNLVFLTVLDWSRVPISQSSKKGGYGCWFKYQGSCSFMEF